MLSSGRTRINRFLNITTHHQKISPRIGGEVAAHYPIESKAAFSISCEIRAFVRDMPTKKRHAWRGAVLTTLPVLPQCELPSRGLNPRKPDKEKAPNLYGMGLFVGGPPGS